jgi:hypothetical protein
MKKGYFKLSYEIPKETNRSIDATLIDGFNKSEWLEASVNHFLNSSIEEKLLVLCKLKRSKVEKAINSIDFNSLIKGGSL